MVNVLIDTSVLVDVLRGYDPAHDWLKQQTTCGVSQVVWMELLQGAMNKRAQQHALKLLKRFDVVPIADQDAGWAIDMIMKYSLSHHVMALDAMIAAASYRLQVPLYTRNSKHFMPMLGHLVHIPY